MADVNKKQKLVEEIEKSKNTQWPEVSYWPITYVHHPVPGLLMVLVLVLMSSSTSTSHSIIAIPSFLFLCFLLLNYQNRITPYYFGHMAVTAAVWRTCVSF